MFRAIRRKYALKSTVFVWALDASGLVGDCYFAKVTKCDNQARRIEVQWYGDVDERGGDMKLLKRKKNWDTGIIFFFF